MSARRDAAPGGIVAARFLSGFCPATAQKRRLSRFVGAVTKTFLLFWAQKVGDFGDCDDGGGEGELTLSPWRGADWTSASRSADSPPPPFVFIKYPT